jgi:signal transduction histidine kinase
LAATIHNYAKPKMSAESRFASIFAPESEKVADAVSNGPAPWQVLLVDDAPTVHEALHFALKDMVVEGRGLRFFDAASSVEAQAALAQHPDIALIFLDVVMETEDAGLRFVEYVRQQLGNRMVRIVILTGQPAYALARDVVANYEIDDYRQKSDLTSDKLFTCVYAGLRTYQALCELEKKKTIEQLAIELQHANQQLKIEVADRTKAQALAVEQMRELLALNTKLEEAHNQLLQSEKMASIGLLAAGVAHEINNPIGFINSNLGTLKSYGDQLLKIIAAYEAGQASLDPAQQSRFALVDALKVAADFSYLKDDLAPLLQESQDGLDRVKVIVQSLKDFSRIETTDTWAMEDVTKGIESTLSVVWNELKYKCEVRREFGEIPPVECVLSHLNQVFLNMLVNAAHAIVEHGTVTIRTGCAHERVWIEIADTGKGIAQEHLTHIFDPFFTTKPVGKGTGLGLSISYGIIKKHHGEIEVESQPGHGTVFRIWLPIRQPAATLSDGTVDAE